MSTETKRVFTTQELSQFDGKDESTPVYIAIKGKVFDCSSARHFYGKGGSYAVFAGRDASRNLAKMDLLDTTNSSIDDLTEEEHTCLNEWIAKLTEKYPIIGSLEG